MNKKLSKNIICVAIAAIIIGFITLICASGQIAYEVADNFECWRPDYEMIPEEEMRSILSQKELSPDDYALLYKQTGLTQIGIDRARENGEWGKKRVLEIQQAYFEKHTVEHYKFAPYICTCNIGEDFIPNIYLEDGDVIVSSSTQFFGWRMGHAGLVTDGDNGRVLQATAVGEVSYEGDIEDFTNRITFMIFSPRASEDTKHKVVDYALNTLVGLYYNPLQGVFNSKNSIKTTQCSHLVWYAYNKFGIDLDYNGGGIVTPKDLANSKNMELVHVFGFDPNKLWK